MRPESWRPANQDTRPGACSQAGRSFDLLKDHSTAGQRPGQAAPFPTLEPNKVERAFRAPTLSPAVKKELNLMRRNSMAGEALLKALPRLYQQHSLGERTDPQRQGAEQPIPRIVCSESLT